MHTNATATVVVDTFFAMADYDLDVERDAEAGDSALLRTLSTLPPGKLKALLANAECDELPRKKPKDATTQYERGTRLGPGAPAVIGLSKNFVNEGQPFVFFMFVVFGTIAVFVASMAMMLVSNADRDWTIKFIVEGASGWSTDPNGRNWSMPMAAIIIMLVAVTMLFDTVGFRYLEYALRGWKLPKRGRDNTSPGQWGYVQEVVDGVSRGRLLFLYKGIMEVALFVQAAHVANMNQLGNVALGALAVYTNNTLMSGFQASSGYLYRAVTFVLTMCPWLWCAINIQTEQRNALNLASFWVTFIWVLLLDFLFCGPLGAYKFRNYVVSKVVDAPETAEEDARNAAGRRSLPAITGGSTYNVIMAFVYLTMAGAAGGCAFAKIGNTDGRASWTVGDITEYNRRWPVGMIGYFVPAAILCLTHFVNYLVSRDMCCTDYIEKHVVQNDAHQRPYLVQSYGFALAEAAAFLIVAAAGGISELFENLSAVFLIISSAVLVTTVQTSINDNTGKIVQHRSEYATAATAFTAGIFPYLYAAVSAKAKNTIISSADINESTTFVFTLVVLVARLVLYIFAVFTSNTMGNDTDRGGIRPKGGEWDLGSRTRIMMFFQFGFLVLLVSFGYGSAVLI